MQIVLDTRGLQMSVRNGCFFFKTEKETRMVHPNRVNSILVTSACRISSPALVLASINQIPLTVCDGYGRPQARIWSPRFVNTSKLRRNQYHFTSSDSALKWASGIIGLKIKGQISNLKFLSNRKSSLAGMVNRAIAAIERQNVSYSSKIIDDFYERKKQLLFTEAFAASQYWQLIGKELHKPFQFENRIKRQPTDGFNAGINYLYGMLRNQVETAVLSIGLDPTLGIVHRDGYKMPSLVFDLMEPFRPVMDRLLLTAILEGNITDDAFQKKELALQITKTGRKQLIELFVKKLHSRILYRGSGISLNNHILTEVKQLSNIIKTTRM